MPLISELNMNPKNIYLISGNSDFLIDKRIKELKEYLLKDSSNMLNYEEVDGASQDLEKFFMGLNTPSLFSMKKLLHIKNFYLFKKKEKEYDFIENNVIDSITKILPENYVIFSSTQNIDRRMGFVKKILKLCQYEEYNDFSVFDEESIVSWIINNAKNKGYEIDKETSLLIKDSVNGDLRSIDQEIDKIITYVGIKTKTISKDDISIIMPTSGVNSFKLMSAIREWRKKDASYLIYRMLKDGEEPVRLLNYIISHVRFLFILKASCNQSIDDISRSMGVFNMSQNTFYLSKCLNQIKKLTIEQLKKSYMLAQETDFLIKTGQIEPRTAVEDFTNNVFIEN